MHDARCSTHRRRSKRAPEADPTLACLLLFEGVVDYAVFKDGSDGGRDQEDDLLAALDRALDEIEEEQRVEAIRELASPAWDKSEIVSPSSELSYRRIIESFMGSRRDLPRTDHLKRRRAPARDPELSELLGASMARARRSLERRRAKVWVVS